MICIIILLVYWFCPQYLRIAVFLVNLFVPDEIPMIDEIIMLLGLFSKKR